MKRKNWKIIILALSLPVFLASCSPFGDDPSNEFISRISFNLWDFLATFLAFIVLLLVVFYFGYKPIKKSIQKRNEYIDGKIKTAEEREKKSTYLISEANDTVKQSKKEVLETINKAKEDTNKEKERIIELAKEEAKLEKEKAREEIKQEIEASKDEIRNEIIDVALVASSEILGREVKKEDNERLLNDFIDDLNNKEK